jgi:hypothetical protein
VWKKQPTGGEHFSQTELLYIPSQQAVLALGYGYGGLWTKQWAAGWSAPSEVTPAPHIEPGSVAFDRVRGRVVVLDLKGTWEWEPPNGSWQLLAGASPGPPIQSPMAYDETRSVTVLYSGDIWEWDGIAWTKKPSVGPVPRDNPAMTYDPSRGGVVMHGGSRLEFDGVEEQQVYENDTWLYDGASWEQIAGSGSAPSHGRLVFDRGRDLLQVFAPKYAGDMSVWELVAGVWQHVQAQVAAPSRGLYGAAYDEAAGVTLVSGGMGNGQILDDTWSWDGQLWSMLESVSSPPPTMPGGMSEAACSIAYAGFLKRVVLVYLGTAWEWDGSRWRQQATAAPPLEDTALSYDSARGRLVLVGTASGKATDLLQTWEYDGQTWAQIAAAVAPPPRWGSCMTYDAARSRTVLFGGRVMQAVSGGSIQFNADDTWEWDGQTWVEVSVAARPDARIFHGMAWDEVGNRVVLFGGSGGPTGQLDDTWTYDGSSWTPLGSNVNPPHYYGRLTYDDVERRIVLVGGEFGVEPAGRTWFLQGNVWSPLSSSMQPAGDGAVAFDPLHRQVVFYGDQTWLMTTPDCVAAAECATGFCVDGVCCDSACGGGDPGDGFACSVQAGAERNGVCGPFVQAVVEDGPSASDGSASGGDGPSASDGSASGGCVVARSRSQSVGAAALLFLVLTALRRYRRRCSPSR